jgi:enoyl-CoA hydratase/carnithine racemase
MPAELLASRHESALVLTLSNPGMKNALDAEVCAAAIEVLSTAERDDSIRAVVLTGAGDYFCSGSSLHQLLENRSKDQSVQAGFIDNVHSWIEAIHDCPKPVIAAIEGGAAGAGLSLALACDLIIAGNSAAFAMPNVRAGLTPEGAGAWLLCRSLPRQIAAEMLFEGTPLAATRLHAMGVVNRLAADNKALDAALDWADALGELAPNAIEQIKSLLAGIPQQSLDRHFDAEKQAFIESLFHHNSYEGIRAFLEQRKPNFK